MSKRKVSVTVSSTAPGKFRLSVGALTVTLTAEEARVLELQVKSARAFAALRSGR